MATRKAIEHRVHTVIDTMGTACPFKIANKMHIPIVYTKLPKQIRGYMLHIQKGCCIVVSDSINNWEAPMVVAHEMGHYFLHDKQFYLFHYNFCFTITAVNTDVQDVNMKPTYLPFTCYRIN